MVETMKNTTLASAVLWALLAVSAPASADMQFQERQTSSIDQGWDNNLAHRGEFDGQLVNAALAYSLAGDTVVDFGSISGTSEMMWLVAFDEQGRMTYYLLSDERWSERSPPGGSYLGGYLVVMKGVANTRTYDPGRGVDVPVLGNDEDAFQVTTMDWHVLVEDISAATKSIDATIMARSLAHAYSVRTVTAMLDLYSVATVAQVLDPAGEIFSEWVSGYGETPVSSSAGNVDCAAFGEDVADLLIASLTGAEMLGDVSFLVVGLGGAGAISTGVTAAGGGIGSLAAPGIGTAAGTVIGGAVGGAGAAVWSGAVGLADMALDAVIDAEKAVLETDGKDFATSLCQQATNQPPDGTEPPGRPPTGGGTTQSPEAGYFGYYNLCGASATEMDAGESDNSNDSSGGTDTNIEDTDTIDDADVSEEIVVYGERDDGDEDECISVEVWVEE